MKSITLKAPAKINLALSILGKLSSGYHELRSIFQQVSLFDRIHIQEIPHDEIRVFCNDKSVPTNKFNTVYQAALLVKRLMGIKKGVEIKIKKEIPVGAGLGGGSSDAAQTLIGLNKIWNLGLNTADLMKLGVKIGMDVCYQLVGGTKLGTHRGEKLKSLPSAPKMTVVLCNPGVEVSTKWAYEYVDYSQVGGKQIKDLIEALKEGNIRKLSQNLHNDFEFWVPNFYPAILKIKKKMLAHGALGVAMTGTGPTVFGICGNYAAGQRVYQVLKKEFPKTYLVKTL